MEQRIDEQFLKEIKLKLSEGETDEVMDDLKAFLEPMLSTKYFDEWVLHSGNYRRTERDFRKGLLTTEQYRVQMARANNSLLEFVNELHRKGLKKQHPTSAMPTGIISKDHLVQEKVIGRSNLNSISWLRHGMEASKSVCKIILADKNCGTGFLLPDGSLMTNHHVLPDEATARFAKVAFDYEEDMNGQIRQTIYYQVDASTYRSDRTLDYAIVQLNPASNDTPLSNWGALEPRLEPLPAVEDYVTIVQHPEGNPKQLSFDRISKVDNDYLLYKADTLGGSSGSPVFDSNWKVLALHHGSLNKEDANRGTLMRAIKKHLGADCKW